LQFALLFAFTAAGIVAGAFVSAKLVRRIGSRPTAGIGLVLSLLGPAALAALLLLHSGWLAAVMLALFAATFGNGLINPAATQGALAHFPAISGLVGALLTTVQMGCCALSSGIAALCLGYWGIAAVPAVMLMFAAAATAILLFATSGKT